MLLDILSVLIAIFVIIPAFIGMFVLMIFSIIGYIALLIIGGIIVLIFSLFTSV